MQFSTRYRLGADRLSALMERLPATRPALEETVRHDVR
jgi:hypothetical protein